MTKYLEIGQIVNTFGIKGMVKVKPFTDDNKRFDRLEKVYIKNKEKLKEYNGIVVPGGFGNRGIEGMITAIQYVRENNVPFLGICLGMQMAVVEFARNVLKLEDVNSEEFNENAKNKVIHIMDEQKEIKKKGGTMRLGA